MILLSKIQRNRLIADLMQYQKTQNINKQLFYINITNQLFNLKGKIKRYSTFLS
jgi:hypothetical protein